MRSIKFSELRRSGEMAAVPAPPVLAAGSLSFRAEEVPADDKNVPAPVIGPTPSAPAPTGPPPRRQS